MLQISKNIKQARVKAGKTQQEVADLLNIKRSTYANCEKDIEPDFGNLKKLSKILDISINDLTHSDDDLNDLIENQTMHEEAATYQQQRLYKKNNGHKKEVPCKNKGRLPKLTAYEKNLL